jgi:ABC transporter substrate binding protein (PQQ-dependent alcohol dehydrogenase system)
MRAILGAVDRDAALIRSPIIFLLVLLGLPAASAGAGPLDIAIGYLRVGEPRTTISLIDTPAENDGLAGAQLAIVDNKTTGRFLDQDYSLNDVKLATGDGAAAAIAAMADRGVRFVVADLPADALLTAADAAKARGLLVVNAGTIDERVREQDCRPNLIHTAPSRSMLADGLAQYLVWKKWRQWLLVVGSHAPDRLYADAIRRAARRFGGKIVEERVFEDTGGARRTDSGLTQIQRQIPMFTQSAPGHDVLVAADESDVFAPYLPYRTWDPRPVAGSAGLVPTSWDASHDQWGAVQLQNRFMARFSRRMTALDMQAWSAVRMIGEAAARTRVGDPARLIDFFKGPDFALAAFKGQKLTLRDWNLQLRQPILLTDRHVVVSVSPQEGFLHPVTELDTLGYDRPETACRLQ